MLSTLFMVMFSLDLPHTVKKWMLHCFVGLDSFLGQITEHFQQQIQEILSIIHHIENLV